MKLPSPNPNYRAALVLIIMAGVLITTAILTNRGDFTSAALVMAGLVCLLTGIFFATLSGSDPLDLRYLGLFSVQGSINLTRTCADLGIQGNACFIPKGRDGRTRTMQFLPGHGVHWRSVAPRFVCYGNRYRRSPGGSILRTPAPPAH